MTLRRIVLPPYPSIRLTPNVMDSTENPFQMDEELSFSEMTPQDLDTGRLDLGKTVSPRPSEPHQTSKQNTIVNESKLLRSRIDHIKLEDGAGTTTEEDETAYDEDIDDKFDKEAAAKLEAQFYASQDGSSHPLSPPENFAPVINNIYRSSFPQPPSFAFLKTLNLKSVLCLIPEEYPQTHTDFFAREGIQLFQLGMSGNKEPFVIISSDLITEAAKIVLNPANQPILIHCNRGKHRTGCLVGILRRLQGWSLTIIFDEYRKFAAPKERPMDQQFIELYDETNLVKYAEDNNFVPLNWD